MPEDARAFVFGLIDELGLRPLLNDDAVREAASSLFSEIGQNVTVDDLGRIVETLPDPVRNSAAEFWQNASADERKMIREAAPDALEETFVEYWRDLQEPDRPNFDEGSDFFI